MKATTKQNNSTRLCLALLALIAAVGSILLYFGRLRLLCPINTAFDVYCPGCGSGRAVYSLLHFQFAAAFSYNPFFVLSLPLIAYMLGVIYLQSFFHRGMNAKMPGKVFWVTYFVLLFIFTVLRNIPVFPFTFLAP